MRSCMGSFPDPKSVQARLRLEKLKLDLVPKRIATSLMGLLRNSELWVRGNCIPL